MNTLLDLTENLIIAFEVGGGKSYYDKKLSVPTQPTPGSGITIGIGYDLWAISLTTFLSDWKDQLPAPILSRLGAVVGLNQQQAARALPALQDIRVPWENALFVFRGKTLAQIRTDTCRIFPQTPTLPPECQAALYSLVYNRGTRLTGDSRQEMLAIRTALTEGKPTRIPVLIRAMKRLWLHQPGGPGLTLRREAEAALFEKGLAKEPEMIS